MPTEAHGRSSVGFLSPSITPAPMPDDPKAIPVATPIAKPPTVSKAPPPGRKFPCPACGARLDFDPAARGLKCPFCGHQEAIARDADGQVVEHDYRKYLDKLEHAGGEKTVEGHSSQVRCPGCGA